MENLVHFQHFENSFFLFIEYVKAAQILKEEDSTIKLAKVDGPEETALLEKMHVTGYPTIFFYRDGEPIKYGGIFFQFLIITMLHKLIVISCQPSLLQSVSGIWESLTWF